MPKKSFFWNRVFCPLSIPLYYSLHEYFASQTMILFSGLKSWTLKQTESWGESKTFFKGEVYGLKKEEGEGRKNISSVLPAPSPLVFFSLSRWWPRSMYLWVSVKKYTCFEGYWYWSYLWRNRSQLKVNLTHLKSFKDKLNINRTLECDVMHDKIKSFVFKHCR